MAEGRQLTEQKSQTTASTPDAAPSEQKGTAVHYWQFCVNCGTPLEGRKCKLICPKCGFYHSCSEP